MVIALFFLGMLNFITPPFERLAFTPKEGSDLNPLLQNYWMTLHPPSLYLGYVSASVPFAFAIAALITGKLVTCGFVRPGAGRSPRGSFCRSAIFSADVGRSKCWVGAATGPGTPWKTRPSCRGSQRPHSFIPS